MSELKEGQLDYFCNCLLTNYKEHTVSADKEGNCVYCGHHALLRPATAVDVRASIKWEERLHKIKMEHLEMLIKDRRHNEKVN